MTVIKVKSGSAAGGSTEKKSSFISMRLNQKNNRWRCVQIRLNLDSTSYTVYPIYPPPPIPYTDTHISYSFNHFSNTISSSSSLSPPLVYCPSDCIVAAHNHSLSP